MRLRPLTLTTALASLVLLAGCERSGSHAPAGVGASAPPPPPSSAAAAAAPVAGTAAPISVPTPAGTTLSLARTRAAAQAALAAGGSSPCAGLRGPTLDACIDAAARTSASPVAIDEDADREFRAAQARRDQDLMDRDEEDARLAGQGSVGQPSDEEPGYDPRNDPRDYDPRDNGEADDPGYDPSYDDSNGEPPPDNMAPIDEPPPDPGYYPRR